MGSNLVTPTNHASASEPAKYVSPFGDSEDQPVIPDAGGRMRSAGANKLLERVAESAAIRPSRSANNTTASTFADAYFSLPNTPDTEADNVDRAGDMSRRPRPQRPVVRLSNEIGGESYI